MYSKRGAIASGIALAALALLIVSSATGLAVGEGGGEYSVSATNISSCQTISSSGYYILNKSVSTGGDCFTITADNVTIDCDGFNITGDGGSRGVYALDRTNVTIKNCNIFSFGIGIKYGAPGQNTTNSFIDNCNISNSGTDGIELYGCFNISITNSKIKNSGSDGINAYTGKNHKFTNVEVYNCSDHGFYIYESHNAIFESITASNNTQAGFYISRADDGTYVNITAEYNGWEGVYLHGASNNNILNDTQACFNNQASGSYYDISDFDANTFSNNTCDTNLGTTCHNRCTYYNCGDTITQDTTLFEDINMSGAGTCITIGADDITLDCAGFNLNNTNKAPTSYGVNAVGRYNVTIKNCNITEFFYGVYFESTNNSFVINNTVSNSEFYGIYLKYSNETQVFDNRVSPSNGGGIHLLDSEANEIFNNIAENAGTNGISLSSSSNNNLINNTANSNTQPGIYLTSSSNNNLINNTAGSNSEGIYISSSSNNILLLNNTLSGNSGNEIDVSSSTGITLKDQPVWGDYSFVNAGLIFEDTGEAQLRFLNTSITELGDNLSADIQIGNNSITVNSTGQPGFNTSANLTFYSITGFFDRTPYRNGEICPASICTEITDAETYVFNVTSFTNYSVGEGPPACGFTITEDTTLTEDLNQSGSGDCLTIGADDITLDCAGFNIDGTDSGFGIFVNGRDNITIKNCNVTDFTSGIYFFIGTNNSFIDNTSSSSNNMYGIIIQESTNNTLTLNTANSNTKHGIYLTSSSNNYLINNTAKNNVWNGVHLTTTSSNNKLISTTTEYNNRHGVLLSSDSINNVLNNTRACFNNQDSGSYYDLYDDDANTFSNNTCDTNVGTTCHNPCIPLACGDTITANSFLAADLINCSGNGLNIAAHNIVLDCRGHNINGSGSNYGIQNTGGYDNVIVRNCNITGFDRGFYWDNGANHGTIFNNTVENNNYGMRLEDSLNITVKDNTIKNNTLYGIYTMYGLNNTIIFNMLENNGNGIHLMRSHNNTIANNTATSNNIGIQLYDTSSNNIFINNTVNNNTQQGIYIYKDSNNNYFLNNTLNSNNMHGIYLRDDSSNNIFINNTANNNPRGILFGTRSNNNTLTSNTLSGNSLYQIEISGSTGITLKDQLVYGSYSFINAAGLIFEDSGEAQLSFLENVTGSGSNLSAAVRIDSNLVTVDSAGESEFNKRANLTFYNTTSLGFSNRTPYRNGVSCPASICTELSDADTYIFNVTSFTNYSVGEWVLVCGDTITEDTTLTAGLSQSGAGTCLIIGADHITLDCAGFNIDGDDTSGSNGVYVNGRTNVTIKNCNVTDFESGITLNSGSCGHNIINNSLISNTAYGITVNGCSGNLIDSNNASFTSSFHGIDIQSSHNNIIVYNTVRNNSQMGIKLSSSSNNNTVMHNEVYHNTANGINVQSSDNINITSNTISGSGGTGSGIYVYAGSVNITIQNNSIYGNTAREIYLRDSSSILLKDQDIHEFNCQFSNIEGLKIEDSGEARIAFLENISGSVTNLSATIQIGSNVVDVDTATDSEFNVSANITIYNTNSLGLTEKAPYRNGERCPVSICTELSDADAYIFNVTSFTNYSVGEWYPVCGDTITNDTNLTADLTGCSGNGLDIGAHNIVLDCRGYNINGSDSNYGVNNIGYDNVTVKNCNITNFATGIYYANNADDGIILNNTASGNTEHGIQLFTCLRANITLNTASYNTQSGIYLLGSSTKSYIVNNIANNNSQFGIRFWGSSHNILVNNTAEYNGRSGVWMQSDSINTTLDDTWACFNNQSGGGWYDIEDDDASILTDNTCDTAWNTTCHNACPLYCGKAITLDTTMAYDLSCTGDGLIIGDDDITLDCAGFKINGTDQDYGIKSTGRDNITIKNCNVTRFLVGIYLQNTNNSFIINSTANSNSFDGILLSSGSNNTLRNNNAKSNDVGIKISSGSNNILSTNTANDNIRDTSRTGIYLTTTSNNTLTNNTATGNEYGIQLSSSPNNNIINNTATGNDYGIYLSSSNYNTLINNTFSGSIATQMSIISSTGITLKDQPVGNYNFNTAGLVVEDSGEAQLRFLETITGSGTNISAAVKIGSNLVDVDTASESEFNKSANITIYDTNSLGLVDRIPYRDGEACPASICTALVDADTYVFNVTHFTNYSVGEDNPPTFSNALNTSVDFKRNHNFVANITINDEVGLSSYLFSTNASGSWANTSAAGISGTQYNASEQANITVAGGSTVCWYYWANDTLNKNGTSSTYCFTVANTAPEITAIAVSHSSPNSSVDLNCTYSASDVDGQSLTPTFDWYKGGVVQNINNQILAAGNTSEFELWNCSVNVSDGAGWDFEVSSGVVIADVFDPTFSGAVNVSVDFRRNHNFVANITMDNLNLSSYLFSTNASGSWANTSAAGISGVQYSASEQANVTVAGGSTVCWYYWANDTSNNNGTSSTYCFTVANTPPEALNVTINSTDALNKTNGTLTGAWDFFDIDDDSQTENETRWFNNSIEVVELRNLTSISPENTTKHENWTFSARVYDGTDWSAWVNSTELTIQNAAPEITLTAPDNYSYTRTSFNFTYNVNDLDSISDVDYCELWKNNGTGWVLYSNSTSVNATNNISYQVGPGNHTEDIDWHVNCTDTDNAETQSSQRTIYVDNVNPIPHFDNPKSDNTTAQAKSNTTFNLDVKVENDWLENVTLVITNSSLEEMHRNESGSLGGVRWYNMTYGIDVSGWASGNYTVEVNASDLAGNNLSASRMFRINAVPSVVGVNITSSDNLNRTNGTLIGGYTFSDSDGDSEAAKDTKWYNNSVEVVELKNLTSIDSENTTKDEVWTFSVRVFDSYDWSDWENATITIQNAAPVVTSVLISPSSPNSTVDLNCTYSATDVDGQLLTPTFDWYKGGVVQNINSQVLAAGNITEGEQWNCSVNVSDGTDWDFEVSSAVAILDEIPPVFSNAVNTSVDFRRNHNFVANITINNLNLSSYLFSTNASGSWANTSAAGISGSQYNASEQANVTVAGGSAVCWSYWANDTSNNNGTSSRYCFTVANTAPEITAIAVSPSSPNSSVDLNCTYSASDVDGQSLTPTFDWYKEGASQSINNQVLAAGNTSEFEKWNCSVNVSDGADWDFEISSSVVIADVFDPVFSSAVNGSVDFRRNHNFVANITIDNAALDAYVFSTNVSGSWINTSAVSISGVQYSASEQANVTVAGGSTVCWSYWANDTFGNDAVSSAYCFVVVNTAPSVDAIAVSPSSPNSSVGLNCTYSATDVDVQSLTPTFNWYKNNVVQNINSQVLASGNTSEFELWNCSVNVSDGADWDFEISSGVVIADVFAPTFSGAVNGSVDFRRNHNFVANITINNLNLSSYLFSTNASGSWINTSAVSISGVQYNASEQANVTVAGGSTVCWYYWANDTSGNDAVSSTYCFVVVNTAPTIDAIAVSPSSPNSSVDLNCTYSASDVDGQSLTSTFDWYKNNVVQNINNQILASGNTSEFELWNCSVNVSDGADWDFEISSGVVIADVFAPTFSNAVNTSADFRRNHNFVANITINNLNLSSYLFSTNASGSWANTSAAGISGSQYNASEQANVTVAGGSTVCWYYWANDTSGNDAVSSTYCFVVVNTAPTIDAIAVSPSSPNSSVDLNCTYSATDADGQFLTPTFDWYKNNVVQNINSQILASGNTSEFELWNCSVNVSDGAGWDFEISSGVVIADVFAPTFSNAVNTSADFKINSSFIANITIINNDLSSYLFSTNASGSWANTSVAGISGVQYNASEQANVTVAGGSTVCWYYWASDTSNNNGTSSTYCFIVQKETAACSLTLDPPSPATYGNAVNASCSCTSPEAAAALYRNETNATSSENNKDTVIPGGSWEYVCNVSETQNYTYAENTSAYTVNKGGTSATLYINGSTSDFSSNITFTANITCVLNVSGNVNIIQNETQIAYGASPLQNISTYSVRGDYLINCSFAGTQNYSASSDSSIIHAVDLIPPVITITIPANNSIINKSYLIGLNVSVDKLSLCKYSIDSGSYTSLGVGNSFSTTFSIYENALHNATVNCTDNASNIASAMHLFTVNDTTYPNITSKSPSGSITETSPTLAVATDEPAICAYSLNDTSFDNMTGFTSTNSTTSTETLSLSPGSYTYYVKCRDRLNNTMTSSENISFTITEVRGGGGGGRAGCRSVCEPEQTGCNGTENIAVCSYDVSGGCWQWTVMPCLADEECIAGECVTTVCREDWICGDWSPCEDGVQTRNCEDWNSCGSTNIRPEIVMDCIVEEELVPEEEEVAVEEKAAPIEERPTIVELIKGIHITERLGAAKPELVNLVLAVALVCILLIAYTMVKAGIKHYTKLAAPRNRELMRERLKEEIRELHKKRSEGHKEIVRLHREESERLRIFEKLQREESERIREECAGLRKDETERLKLLEELQTEKSKMPRKRRRKARKKKR